MKPIYSDNFSTQPTTSLPSPEEITSASTIVSLPANEVEHNDNMMVDPYFIFISGYDDINLARFSKKIRNLERKHVNFNTIIFDLCFTFDADLNALFDQGKIIILGNYIKGLQFKYPNIKLLISIRGMFQESFIRLINDENHKIPILIKSDTIDKNLNLISEQKDKFKSEIQWI